MEVALGPVIAAMVKLGAPWIICAVFVVLFVAERKKKDQLADRLFDLAVKVTEKTTEFNVTMKTVERDIDEITRRFNIPKRK